MKVYIYTHDPVLHMAYSEQEAENLFGPDDGNGLIEIPDELYFRFLFAQRELYAVSHELKRLHKLKK